MKVSETIERFGADWSALSGFSDDSRPGWTRTVFSDAYRAERSWISERFRDCGLHDVYQDAAGNIIGRMPGRSAAAPPLVIGSHTDTVDGGGRFDGIVGVLGALQIVQQLRESGTQLRRDLVVIDFFGEEPNRFGLGCLGSRALAGDLRKEDLDRLDFEGRRLAEAYREFGLEPEALLKPEKLSSRPWHAYLELHIEQGRELEKSGNAIGVVTAIAGIQRLVTTFIGSADHAGGRHMHDRRDAMVAAAAAVLEIRHEACAADSYAVGTTTHLVSEQDSVNVVPGLVKLHAEIRSTDQNWLTAAERRLTAKIASSASSYGVDAEFDWNTDNLAVDTNARVRDAISQAADCRGIAWEPIPSGATHDAAHLAHLAPMGMIFVPSSGGRSHCPEEWTDFAQIGQGISVLLDTVLEIDRLDRVSA